MQVLPPGRTGGPSRLFIMRPVATTLLMVAILLAGIIGYRFLPVSALLDGCHQDILCGHEGKLRHDAPLNLLLVDHHTLCDVLIQA